MSACRVRQSDCRSWLSFTAAFAVDFVTIIVLYTIATSLLWTWFRSTDKESAAAVPTDEATLAAATVASESPSLLERA
jgi:membrane protein implicated in regulation of membrane protease activity